MPSIAIVALGVVEEDALATLELSVWETFGFEIQRLPPQENPEFAFDEERRQYSSEKILRSLLKEVRSDTVKLLGVTPVDMFIPMLSFVFGQAQLHGKVAAISLARLRQEFYGLEPNRGVFLHRTAKEAIHELGHTWGLTHCRDRSCPMALATNLQQLDRKTDELCTSCSIMLRETVRSLHRSGYRS